MTSHETVAWPRARTAVAVEDALARVGASVGELRELLGALLDEGRGYVVGSLAAGLGNSGSDIDVIVLCDRRSSDAPMLFFLGDTSVDLQYYNAGDPAATMAALPGERVRLAAGWCALGCAPAMTLQRRIGRWLNASPLDPAFPDIVDPAATPVAAAALVRGAVESLVLKIFAARTIGAAGLPSAAAWRRAGRALVEVLARASGELFIGEKWIVARAVRAGLDRGLARRAFGCSDERQLREILSAAGLSALGEPGVVELRAADGLERLELGATTWTLVGGRRAVPCDPAELVPEALETASAATVLDAVAEGVVVPALDRPELDERVRACAA
ncbi:nucleotidyltransferase domain-containing protein [Nocardia mexicana]|uniref:Nucleotidyltransferase-like protein n=1 Tax=Nocardia mexicana TaxID=279262 RepID=A0A370HEW4_9NOCA|nr:nucleotidyltransferase domain-containing protein [Nocardia mexicana]RDI55575.1 nucleotidyltransferase-like protein [Nocardia mexicana]